MSISIILIVLLFPDFAFSLVNKDIYQLVSPYLFDSYTARCTKKCECVVMLINPCKKTESNMIIMYQTRDVTSRLKQNEGPYFVTVDSG